MWGYAKPFPYIQERFCVGVRKISPSLVLYADGAPLIAERLSTRQLIVQRSHVASVYIN